MFDQHERATGDIHGARQLMEELSRELGLYRRLGELADRSLDLLQGGGAAGELVAVLEEKRRLLGEVREIQAAARGHRETWRRAGAGAPGQLLEMERLTAEMEDVLRDTIRKEEQVDLHLRARGLVVPGRVFAPHRAWERVAALGMEPDPGEIARVG